MRYTISMTFLLIAALLACSDTTAPRLEPPPSFDGPADVTLAQHKSSCGVELLAQAHGAVYGCYPEPYERAAWMCPTGKTPWFFYDGDGRMNGYLCFRL